MTDPYTAPGLTPGHLGAPVVEPDGDAPRQRLRPPDPRKVRTSLACCLSLLGLAAVVCLAVLVGLAVWPQGGPSAADFAGNGSGSVQVSVAQGASLTQIGNALVRSGVVASTRAFTEAAAKSPAGDRIQPGMYTLRQRMSAVSALNVLLDPANANALTIPEGRRAEQVYASIDDRLKLPPGTAKATARDHAADLGLPDDADSRPEGYLFPASYPVTSESTALGLLQLMVRQALKTYELAGVADAASANDLTPYQLVAVASLAQAEADNPDDMAKVARVIYNRLAKGLPLQLDSTVNYALGRTTLTTTTTDTQLDSPFNTYLHTGLPPTPIDNPGRDALRAATHPAEGDWLYFVTVKPGDTRFTDSEEQQRRNVADFNAYRAQHPETPGPAGH